MSNLSDNDNSFIPVSDPLHLFDKHSDYEDYFKMNGISELTPLEPKDQAIYDKIIAEHEKSKIPTV